MTDESLKKPPGPALYRLALMRLFDLIPIHVALHPEDIACRDQYGSTALHLLCRSQDVTENYDLVRAVTAIVEKEPSVVARPNHQTWTPLHLACEKRIQLRNGYLFKEEMVLQLVRACPESVCAKLQSGSKLKTPFHIAVENDASETVLREMLRLYPNLSTQPDVYNESSYELSGYPLQLLWNAMVGQEKPDLSKMELLLRAAFSKTIDDDPKFRVVDAVCSIPCPGDYATQMLSLNGNQIYEPDGYGFLPLHHAVKHADDEHVSYFEFIFNTLIQHFPEAAKIPFGLGSVLPLHILTGDRGMPWDGGVRQLIDAYPDSLRMLDPRTRLVPVLASAIHADKSSLHLSTTFEILRAAPEVIQANFTDATLH